MTKKDYELIAAVITSVRDPDRRMRLGHKHACDNIANEFARVLARTNPRFDRARFLKACGVEE